MTFDRNVVRRGGWVLGALLLIGLAAGCSGTAVSENARTNFLNADDMVQMTDKMAASITADPNVARLTAQKPMVIVMRPIVNDTNEIIPLREKQMYVARVRTLLSGKPALAGRFVFVLNRTDYEALLHAEGTSTDQLGPVEAAAGEQSRFVPDYSLTGRFYAKTNVNSQQRSDYYLCTYQLTSVSGGQVVWEDTYETKKLIKKQMLD